MKSAKIDPEPAIAKWELWTDGRMLALTRGDEAEAYAETRLAEALAGDDSAGEIVWMGVLTQLQRIRQTTGTTRPIEPSR